MRSREEFTSDARRRLANHYEVAVRSLVILRGYSSLGDSQIGRIVDEAVAGASAEERRNPDQPPTSSFSRLEGLLRDAVEADRPCNIYSAEAARLAQLGAHGAAGLLGHKGYAELQQARREAAREARDGGERGAGRSGERYGELPAAGDRVSAAVTSAYVQQYAGTGLGRGTVQNFAEIGLQRGVYDAYRQEGFSREDIGDAAKTTKTLGWKHDRQAFDDVQRSSRPERAAIVEIHHEKDAEKRTALIEGKRQDLHIDDKPQAAQERWNRNIDRVQQKGRQADHEHETGARAKSSDTTLHAETSAATNKSGPRVRMAKLEVSEAMSNKASAKTMDDGFRVAVTPTKTVDVKSSNANALKAG